MILFTSLVFPGGIPHAYTLLARDFYQLIHQYKQTHRIYLQEYVRGDWTFHVKGLWHYPANRTLPNLTLIGSPNFGHRSVYRDLETQVAIVTDNKGLSEALHKEKTQLYHNAQQVTDVTFTLPERKTPFWVYCATRMIKNLLWHCNYLFKISCNKVYFFIVVSFVFRLCFFFIALSSERKKWKRVFVFFKTVVKTIQTLSHSFAGRSFPRRKRLRERNEVGFMKWCNCGT